MMSFSKEQVQVLLSFLQKLTEVCCSSEVDASDVVPRGAGLELPNLVSQQTVTQEQSTKSLKYSSKELFLVKEGNSKSSSAHTYCHVS